MAQNLNIDVVRKAAAVLEVLSEQSGGFPLHEIAKRLGRVKSSTYRLLLTWERLGYVERDPESGAYRLGVKTIELSRKVAGQNRIAQKSRWLLTSLHARFRESVYLGIYRQGRVLMIDMIESPQPVRVVVDLGEQCYLHASSLGRCVAAYLSDDTLGDHLARMGMPKLTKNTKVTYAELQSILAETRDRGYTINREETVEGAVCVAAPFFSGNGGVLGAVAVSIPVSRITEEVSHDVGRVLKDETRQLSRQLAGMPTEPGTLPQVVALYTG